MSDITVKVQDSTSVDVNVSAGTAVTVSSVSTGSVGVTSKGAKGDTGEAGPQGPQGPAGDGLVSGGTENQFIQKNSATDYDTKWSAYTLPAADGDDGQVLTTNGAATVTFAYPKTIAEDVKNVSGGPLLKGTPVHVTGSVGNLAEVIAADAATNYPAHFVLNEDLADDQEGLGIAIGFINNVDVPDASIYTEGQTVYLGESGGWTTTKPTGANAIQNLGIIIKVNVTGGGPAGKISGIIMGAGRANDVPNIATGNIWAGNADGVATATSVAYIDIANSKVGIGTTTPSQKLEVSFAASTYGARFTRNDALGSSLIEFANSAGVKNVTGYNAGVDGYTIGTSADTHLTVRSTGNVGIGTTSPSKKLHVSGGDALIQNATASNTFLDVKGTSSNAYIRAYSDSNSVWLYQGGNSSYLQAQSGSTMRVGSGTGNLIFSDTSGEVMRTSSGKVGIGVTSPAEKLEVLGNIRLNTVGNQLEFSNANVALQRGASNVLELGGYGGIAFKASAAAIDSQTERMRITDAGNVGIGTTSPSSKLHISGITQTGTQIPFKIENDTSNIKFQVNSASGDYVLQFKNAGNVIKNQLHSNGDSYLNGGNVGIGTTTPSYKLDVAGSARITTDNPVLQISDSDNTIRYAALELNTLGGRWFLSSGDSNAGAGVANSDLWITRSSSGTDNRFRFYRDYNRFGIYSSGTQGVQLDADGISYFNAGNVGIGTTSPASPLHVYSNNAVTNTSGGLTIEQDGAGDALLQFLLTGTKRWVVGIDNDNNDNFKISGTADLGTDNGLTITNSTYNVGIGTASPSAKLDVVGLANINDGSNNVMISSGNTAMTTGVSNTAVGIGAGLENTYGTFNVYVGQSAGRANTYSSNNSFVGVNAGRNNTAASNTALGFEAAYANTNGTGIAAVGYQALRNSTGAQNTAVGYQAGFNNTSGSYNSFVGRKAGLSTTIGDYNAFFGRNAGYSNTSGGSNSFVGANAGYGNTIGNSNSFVGVNTGYSNIDGGSNAFVGSSAGFSNTSGSYNSFVGVSAGYSNTTGNNNSILGRSAGFSNTTGSGNIFIGHQAGYNETGSDKLYIANSNTTTPLIYGDFSLGEITINGDLKVSGGNLRADAVEINGRALTTPATGEYGAGSRLVTQFASGTVTAGKVYVANAGAWAEGDANAGSTSIGMIAVATDAASATEMLIEGVIKLSSNTGFSGAAAGTVLYLSTTAGELTTTAPSTAGEYVRVCGYVVNASTNEVFFSASRDWTAL